MLTRPLLLGLKDRMTRFWHKPVVSLSVPSCFFSILCSGGGHAYLA